MNVGNIGSTVSPGAVQPNPAGEHSPRRAFDKLRIGQQVDLTVLSRLGDKRFAVSLAGESHVVESTAALVVGSRVRAMVAAIGDKLELRYVDTSQGRAPDGSEEMDEIDASEADSEPIAEAEARYRLTLDAQERQQLERVVAHAADGPAMARSGLFLAKMDLPMSTAALQALYEAQKGRAFGVTTMSPASLSGEAKTPALQAQKSSQSEAAPEISNLVSGLVGGDDASELSVLLLEAFAVSDSSASMPQTGGDSATDGDARRELARSLLNTQDDGSIAYRYGTLPVLVADQLVELDLVLFQQRRPSQMSEASRRLIMTLNTHSFGRVQVEARALGERLTITFTAQSEGATQELARYADEIRQLGSRLGWDVEAVRYGSDAQQGGAARHIVDHVLSAGSVDQVL